MGENFSLINNTRNKLPSLSFLKMKNVILGRQYLLSIAFVTAQKSKEINKKYRKKNKAANILSFSLRKNEGELVLCPAVIKREAKSFKKTSSGFLAFLVIHGMLHLKGLKHGKRMGKLEKKYLTIFDSY